MKKKLPTSTSLPTRGSKFGFLEVSPTGSKAGFLEVSSTLLPSSGSEYDRSNALKLKIAAIPQ